MPQKIANILIAFVGLVVLVAASGIFFIVDETQQVVITQFGEALGRPITRSGLYMKWPFVQTANYFEKRVLQWDGDQNQITTREKRYIWVETFN